MYMDGGEAQLDEARMNEISNNFKSTIQPSSINDASEFPTLDEPNPFSIPLDDDGIRRPDPVMAAQLLPNPNEYFRFNPSTKPIEEENFDNLSEFYADYKNKDEDEYNSDDQANNEVVYDEINYEYDEQEEEQDGREEEEQEQEHQQQQEGENNEESDDDAGLDFKHIFESLGLDNVDINNPEEIGNRMEAAILNLIRPTEGVRRGENRRIGRTEIRVRRPILISPDERRRSDKPHVKWLNPPPTKINITTSFEKAKKFSAHNKKWLVVNIQNHEEFSSHQLNRDTWVNETIQMLFSPGEGSFTFWQRGHTSEDGETFLHRYGFSEHELPVIAIIHPTIGAIMKKIYGFISAEDLSTLLLEFDDSHSFTGKKKANTSVDSKSTQEISSSSSTTSTPSTLSSPIPPPPIPTPEPKQTGFKVKRFPFGKPVKEPKANEPAAKISIRIQLPSGGTTTLIRTYPPNAPISVVFASVYSILRLDAISKSSKSSEEKKEQETEDFNEELDENLEEYLDKEISEFEITRRFPKLVLNNHLSNTISELDLSGENLIMMFK